VSVKDREHGDDDRCDGEWQNGGAPRPPHPEPGPTAQSRPPASAEEMRSTPRTPPIAITSGNVIGNTQIAGRPKLPRPRSRPRPLQSNDPFRSADGAARWRDHRSRRLAHARTPLRSARGPQAAITRRGNTAKGHGSAVSCHVVERTRKRRPKTRTSIPTRSRNAGSTLPQRGRTASRRRCARTGPVPTAQKRVARSLHRR